MAHNGTPALSNGKKPTASAHPTGAPNAWAINSTRDLRSFLIHQMLLVANGEVDATQAKCITSLAQQVYNTCKLEIRAAEITAKFGNPEIKAVEFNGNE